MKIVVVKSPKFLSGVLRFFLGAKNPPKRKRRNYSSFH